MSEIRAHTPADVAALESLFIELQEFERQFAPDHVVGDSVFAKRYVARLLQTIHKESGVLLIATQDGQPCGFIAGLAEEEAETEQSYFHVVELVVASGHRGRGTGTCLIEAIENEARARGFRRIVIDVLANSQRVHQLYRSLGYRDYVVSLRKAL